MWLFVVAIIGFICLGSSTWILFRAWRGYRVGGEPFCRACNFDLRGKPESSARCSECGADLSHPDSIVHGRHQRRTGLAITAASGVLLTLALFLGLTVAMFSNIDTRPYLPSSWLVSELSSNSVPTRTAAAMELKLRILRPSPATRSLLSAADRILALQKNPSATWHPEMGDVIESMRTNGILDHERFKEYAQNAPMLGLNLRPRLRRGDRLPGSLSTYGRVGSSTPLIIQYPIRYRFLKPDGKLLAEHTVDRSGSTSSISNWGGSMGWADSIPQSVLSEIPDGPVRVETTLTVHLHEMLNGTWPNQSTPPLTTITRSDSHQLQIFPADATDDVSSIRREGLDQELQAAIAPPQLTTEIVNGETIVQLKLTCGPMPEPVAFDCLLIYPGVEHRFGRLALPKGAKTSWHLGGSPIPSNIPLPPTATVLLRPSATAARNSVEVLQYADVELRWDNVPTRRPGPIRAIIANPISGTPTTQPTSLPSPPLPSSTRPGH